MSNVMLPYYGEIEVTGMSFCEGCKETELQIDESKLFSESVCIERTIAIQCRHLKKCAHLREAINRSEKESGGIMTQKDKIIQDMRRDLLFVMSHPTQSCKVCVFRDRDCTGVPCEPKWRGDDVTVKKTGGGK